MKSFEKYIPEHIRGLGGYVPGKPIRQVERESGVRAIKMASNENPFGPSPRALDAIRQAAAQVNFYPDNESFELRKALSAKYRLGPEHILAIDGTTALIGILARAFLGPGRNAVTSERSFIIYDIAVQAAGGELIKAPMRNNTFDLDAISAALNPATRLIFLTNPNNPTGTMFDVAALDLFLDRISPEILVVLDEAYCDFGEHFAKLRGLEYSRSLDYVRRGRNVIVLRTFSKAHGLAGMRIGYGLGDPELLPYLSRVRPAFSLSSLAEAAAIAALDDEAHIRKTLENNAEQAAIIQKELQTLGLRVTPTSANFIYFETGEDANAVAQRLQNEGIIIRSLVPWGIPLGLRVTVGTPEQNEKFLKLFRRCGCLASG